LKEEGAICFIRGEKLPVRERGEVSIRKEKA